MCSEFILISPLIELALFADDIAFFCIALTSLLAETLLQPYLDKIVAWATKWRLLVSVDKSAALVFSRKQIKDRPPVFLLNDHPIQIVEQFKFLGLNFDSKLNWVFHINSVITKCTRLANFLKPLAYKKSGLNLSSLIRLFKAFVRSRMEYGAIVLSSASTTLINKLDVVQNTIFRSFFGAFNCTPVALLNWELNIEPTKLRWEFIKHRYLINLNTKPFNPAFESILRLSNANSIWKPQSIPSVIPGINFLHAINIPLFLRSALPSSAPPVSLQPPWISLPASFIIFPLTKKEALANPTRAAAVFLELFGSPTVENAHIYTDGSRLDDGSASSAFCVPSANFASAWRLTRHSSIMSAELLAIEKALEHAYSSDFSSIHIFSDSKPSLQSIFNNKPTNLNTVNSIRDIIFNFSSAGTQVSLVWIPSHVNIPGNELADRAAGDCLTSANSPTINNKLNAPELCSLLHAAHILRVSHTLDSRAPSLNLLARQKLGLFPWFLHNEKLVV